MLWRNFFKRALIYLNTHAPEEFMKSGVRAAKDTGILLVEDEEYRLLFVPKPKEKLPTYDELLAHWKATKTEEAA